VLQLEATYIVNAPSSFSVPSGLYFLNSLPTIFASAGLALLNLSSVGRKFSLSKGSCDLTALARCRSHITKGHEP
jgi:hypothetical protein